ncbi:MAG: DUF3987 domain-containing protein [Cyanobacteria bacterium J06638_7]
MTDHHPPRPLPGTTTGRARAAGRSAAAAAADPEAAAAWQALQPVIQQFCATLPRPDEARDRYYGGLAAEAQKLTDLGLTVITVISEQQNPQRWPVKKKNCRPNYRKPAYTGKNPSDWRGPDQPRLLSHEKPPTLRRTLAAIAIAAEHWLPIGLAVIPSTTVVAIDFDAKNYDGGRAELDADVDRLLAAHPALQQTRRERTPSGGQHIYIRVADGMASWSNGCGGHYCNFAITPDGPHRGEVLAGTRVCVTAPTEDDYELVEPAWAYTIAEVASLDAIGIIPKTRRGKAPRKSGILLDNPSPSPATTGVIEVPQLRDLLGRMARDVLNGGMPYGDDDRSANLTGFLRELHSCLNWLQHQGHPYSGNADALIHQAVAALGIEDKADRVIATVNPTDCWASDPNRFASQYAHYTRSAAPPTTTTVGSQQQGGGQQPDDATRNAAAEHLAAAATTIDLADVLHPWLAERLTARARSFPLHPLWLLAPALTATSAIVGIRAKVTVKRGWTEPLIFWTGNVVEASTLKTAAAGVFQGPLTRIEIDDRKAHRDAVKARQEGDPEPPPPIRRLAMDATYEAIASMAAAPQNHGIASFQDELSGWFANLRRDCSATARAGWLQLWSGQPILIDRKTTEPVFAARCAVSLFGNVQPSKLAQMMATTGDGAESAGDGLWARFLWVRPPHVPFRYVEDDVDISSDIRSLLERLNSTPAGTDDDDQPLLIQLDTEARAALAPWWEAWAAEQLCSAPGSAAFLGKLRGYSVRLAGLLALLDVACDALPSRVQLIGMEQLQSHGNGWRMAATADHADRAIRLCLFFLAQFDALQSEIGHGDLPAEVAQLVARARGHGQPVSLRQVMRWKLPHREATSEDALMWLRETVVGTYGIGQVDQGGRQDSWQWRAS